MSIVLQESPAVPPVPFNSRAHAPAGSRSRPGTTSAQRRMFLIDTWISLEHRSQENGSGAPRRSVVDGVPAFTMVASNGTLNVQIASRSAHWNGMEFRLGFGPQMITGRPYVHALDVQKNFEPLLSLQSAQLKPNPVIVIDPGHGGTDTGAKSVNDGRCEKEFTLDLATRLQALLLTNGWTVLLTRSNDQNVALSARVAFAEQHGADLFLSLHFNSAAPSQDQLGAETYCLTPTGMPSNLTRGYEDNAALVFPNNSFDTQNFQLAVRLHRAVTLLKVNGNGWTAACGGPGFWAYCRDRTVRRCWWKAAICPTRRRPGRSPIPNLPPESSREGAGRGAAGRFRRGP